MSFAAGYLVAFGGGIISFLSPCVLPLVPAYLSVVTGLDVAELKGGNLSLARTTRTLRTTLLFIVGFSAVFIVLGLAATSVGKVLYSDRIALTRISGIILIAMGGFLLASQHLRIPRLYSEKRYWPKSGAMGPVAAPVAGMAFAFGWTPCIGPILSSVLAVAATQGQTLKGGLLLAAYSLGLGVPFLAAGLGLSKLDATFSWVKRHFSAITTVSSLVLIFFGILLALNRFIILTQQLSDLMNFLDMGRLITLG